MNKKEIINNLDINKLKKDKSKYKKPYIILSIICGISVCFAISSIKNNSIAIFFINLILFLITLSISNYFKKKIKEIDYYIYIILENNAEINYNKQLLDKYAKENIINHEINNKYHIKAKTITDNEKYFLDIIKKHFGKDYDIRVQVPLASIIEKEKEFESQYQNELNRIIDIGIFDKETSYPLLLIEINDNTHHRKDRQVRDAKVNNICKQAGIKLIAFWTEYSNTEEYIINSVNTNLRDSN